MRVVVVIIIATAIGVAVWYSYRRKERRGEALATFAARYQLEYSRMDPFELLSRPFALCTRVTDGDAKTSSSAHGDDLFPRLVGHLGFQDMEFESEDFNRAFRVKGGDREFAYQFVDARMMKWLLSTGGQLRIRPERFESPRGVPAAPAEGAHPAVRHGQGGRGARAAPCLDAVLGRRVSPRGGLGLKT
jgi:hypothetical protein